MTAAIRHIRAAAIAAALLVSLAAPATSTADPDALDAPPPEPPPPLTARHAVPALPPADATLRLEPGHEPGGRIPEHFVGLSIEWTLVERYMGAAARPAFVQLLRNLGTGMLRIGGGSQDLMPFDPAGPENDNRVITPGDLVAIRETLAETGLGARTPWGVVLGTALAPPPPAPPRSPDHDRTLVTAGVAPTFAGDARQAVAGIELGNEPDLSYASDATRYLSDFAAYAGVTRPFSVIAPSTSEPIAPWESIAAGSVPTRFFWDWPAILGILSPVMRAPAGPFGAFATDHFYPMARGCSADPYRCATIPRLLSDERLNNFGYVTYRHASEAAAHDLSYRVEELGSAAGRGVAGVSDVAASAVWALDHMFNAACPQPPDAPGANADCRVGAVGVNFHNAESRAFFRPGDGNAFYNAVDYDPTAAQGAPTAPPQYYALLLFARFGQATRGLRPVPIDSRFPEEAAIKAWRVEAGPSQRRLFLINKGDRSANVTVSAPGRWYTLHRLTPYDPAGAGRTLDAPAVRIDGRAVAGDGTWPGFQPAVGRISGGSFAMTLGVGEAAVVTLHGARKLKAARG
jgi:hypothetical protein